ncbi:MAG: hypothetical protein MJZ36_08805 [Bacteroidaceae bacterium]|nr:hypothetical protein [Bacteroidaceae bacterium]
MKKLFLAASLLLGALAANAQNPYLPLWEHVPDGEPRVFEDPDNPGKYRAYIIGSHDLKNTDYCGPDIRMWSAPVEDLSQWRDEGALFTHYVDGQWDTMFAPDLVEVKDKTTGKKTYYLYPHSRGNRRVPTVCKGDRPNGPFKAINLTEDGRSCLPGSMIDFDPSVFIENITDKKDKDYDKGFRAYVFYGFQHSTAAELDQNTMYSVRPGTDIRDYFIPASSRYGEVRDPKGTEYPALYKGQNPGEFNFFEASSIRQVGNKYVMVFSGYSGPDYGLGSTNSALRYAFGDSPLGPWRSGGVLVDSRGVVLNEDGSKLTTTNFAHNTHGSLQEINGQWYVFYHRPPRGFGNARQTMVAPVKIEWDKKPVAQGGKVRIIGYDPYVKGNEWSAKASNGDHYTGAEVTSEGFQIYGLNPYAYYSAGIACYINDNNAMQDNWDVWNNSMDIAGLKNGAIVGWKYFGFGGLAKDSKGCKAFEGTKKGDNTKFNINLTPGAQACKIHVMLDGPYANSTWNGKEIAVIDVPAAQMPQRGFGGFGQSAQPVQLSVAVPAVEGLTGKHAIYLVVEGPEVQQQEQPRFGGQRQQGPQRPRGLVDIHGIGFSKDGKECKRPVVPTVSILVDGTPLVMSNTAIFSTNQNGYTRVNRYQIYGRLTDNSRIEVKPSDPAVTYKVGKIADGRAVVTCTYNGVDKIYLIN